MPKGLIGRLIVRLHEQLVTGEDGKKVLWEKGMLLRDNEDTCRALVEETTDKETGGTIIQHRNSRSQRRRLQKPVARYTKGIEPHSSTFIPDLEVQRKDSLLLFKAVS